MPVVYANAFGDVDLTLTEYKFDNSGPDTFDEDRSRYSLRQWADTGWTEVRLRGTIELPSGIDELFLPDERSDPPGKLTLAIDCPDTHYRRGKKITETDIEAGTFDFEETIGREYAYGEVQLKPILVRTTTREDSDELRFARYRYMRIADGRPVTISFDDVEVEGSSFMDVRFESFEKTDAIPDHNLYHVDRADTSSPRVWINEDYDLLTRVLDHDAAAGWAANMQRALAPWIGKEVYVELVLWAILCAGDGEFDARWQEELLDELGPHIYEYTDADTPESLHQQLTDGGDDAQYIVNSVEKVVQDEIRITQPIEDFIEKEATDYFLGGD